MDKKYSCRCGRAFRTKHGLKDHCHAKGEDHSEPSATDELMAAPVDARRETLDDVAGDWPDGAYMAYAEELGLDPLDLCDGEDAE